MSKGQKTEKKGKNVQNKQKKQFVLTEETIENLEFLSKILGNYSDVTNKAINTLAGLIGKKNPRLIYSLLEAGAKTKNKGVGEYTSELIKPQLAKATEFAKVIEENL